MDRFVDDPWEQKAMNDKAGFIERPILHGVSGGRERERERKRAMEGSTKPDQFGSGPLLPQVCKEYIHKYMNE